MLKKLLLACFAISGAAGLIYQIVWIKMLAITFGNTTYAISLVVSAFLAGLALGSHFIGLKSDNLRKPLKSYIILEVLIALTGLAVSMGINFLDDTLIGLMSAETLMAAQGTAIRFLCPFLLLIVPTALMGGTTPLMAKIYIRRLQGLGQGVGALYAANTFGAMFGTFICGLLLIPLLGIKLTVFTAVALNLLTAILLIYGARHSAENDDTTKDEPLGHREKLESQSPSTEHLIPLSLGLILIAGSGFCSLAYEIIWTRAFVLAMKSTVYLFSNILTVFLLGMALGSYLLSRKAGRWTAPLALFGKVQIGLAITGVISVFFFLYLNSLPPETVVSGFSFDWPLSVLANFLLVGVVLLLPTFLMGFGYPLICHAVVNSMKSLGRDIGLVYAIGTLGGIIGSLAAGFLMLPQLGLQNTIFLVSFISLLIGSTALLQGGQQGGVLKIASVLGTIIILLAIILKGAGLDVGLGRKFPGRILFAEEGIMGTVRVIETPANKRKVLMVNNYQLAASGDVAVRFGNIPLLLKPEARDVMLISLGSGITAGSISGHPVTNIDCVEIVPALVKVQPYFIKYNHNVINDKRFHLTLWDGRHYVRLARKKYDLIVADLFQPDSAGVGSLYSLEHFQNVKDKLQPSGAMAQWLPMYQLSPENLKVIMRTFAEVFPHVSVWYGDMISGMPALLLFGGQEQLFVNPGRLLKSLQRPEVKKSMIEHLDPFSFLSFFIMDRQGLQEYCGKGAINTDDRPVIEYNAPRNIRERAGNTLINFASFIDKRQELTKLLAMEQDEQVKVLLDNYFKARTLILQGKIAHEQGDLAREWQLYQQAAKLAPQDPFLAVASFELGFIYYDNRQYERAAEIFELSRLVNPNLANNLYFLARTYEKLGRAESALAVQQQLDQVAKAAR